jgi:outer membrane protein OmpA-like peptidoglycan-associated protein
MPLSIPSAPRDLTVEAPSGTSARLSWRTPETDGGSALQSYSVTTSAGTCSLSSPLATSCSITGLQPGASLSVSLRAVNAAGQSIPANTALTIPNVPGAPSLGVISTGTTFANISWTSPASNGGRVITSYSVEAVEVNQPSQVLRCTSAGLSCVINNLKATTQYSFTVKATNSVGTGAASAAITLTTNRAASTEWDSYRTTTPVVLASQLSLPPAPARVTSQGVGGRRTQITAVRSARDAAIPVTYALISVSTRTNKLLARIKVIVDPQNPSTTVSVPYASSKVKIAVQFANDIGLSPGGPAGTNIAEGNTFEWTTVAGQVTLVGSQVPGGIYFARSSSQLTYTAQQTLKKMAATAKSRGGLVYVTGFAQRGESKSAWMLEPLARARAEAVAKYLSRLGVRQWITFHGTTARATTGWKPITDRRVIVTTVYPTESSPTVSS